MKTLFYFTQPGCDPCEKFDPIMDSIANNNVSVEKVNTDYEADRTRQANVTSVPTVVLAINGQEVKRFTGIRTFQQVMEFYNS